MPAPAPADTKALILDVARRRFAEHGLAATSLSEIADEVGIRRPSLLHHFPSKDALYRAVLEQAFADWFAIVDAATSNMLEGWPQVERVLRAAFAFFAAHPDFVRLARREALDVGPLLTEELGDGLRPLLDRAARFLEGEMDAGRLRRHDARRLLVTGYGAVLSYFSDASLIENLMAADPHTPDAMSDELEHLVELFR
ncbi:MAG TPA: TetR family transcriptional regulator, partial [Acidimicrobiia bacterium]|nr:TetR family transcriptional regulator [Acidimicrobiia bacterium]